MQVIFAGTPHFARIALNAVQHAGFSIPLVLTQADKPAKRGLKMQISAVKHYALEHQLALAQPPSLKNLAATDPELLKNLACDVMVVAAYGLILPDEILAIPHYGCLNIHASLLPRWRGAAPIQRAIEAGDTKTGITIMQMDRGLDTGAIICQQAIVLDQKISSGELHHQLAALGATLIVNTLQTLAHKKQLDSYAQAPHGITYAEKIQKSETQLDWQQYAVQLERRIRAFDPTPGTWAQLPNLEKVKIWHATALENYATENIPGTILAITPQQMIIACGNHSALTISEWQKPGGKRVNTREFLQNTDLAVGMRFF